MWLITWIFKTTLEVVKTPLNMTADLYDAVTDRNPYWKSHTEKWLKWVWKWLDSTFDWDVF